MSKKHDYADEYEVIEPTENMQVRAVVLTVVILAALFIGYLAVMIAFVN